MKKLVLSLGLLPGLALAGGFAVNEQDAAATGRGGTAVAHQGQASAVHYNPAGLSLLNGLAVTAGATGLLPSASSTDPSSGAVTSAETGLKTPPHLYAAYGTEDVSVGLGLNAPYGGGLKWPAEWSGRYEIVEQNLQVLAGHLSLARRVHRAVSVGAGLSYFRATVSVDKRQDFVSGDGQVLLAGSGSGFGFGAGVTIHPEEHWRVGISTKLPTTLPLSGRAHFSDVPPAFASTLQDQNIRTQLTLPGRLAVGGEVDTEPVRLFAEGELTFWRSFKTFAVDFENENFPDVSQARNWRNALTFRLGAEKDFGKNVLRAGVLFDGSSSPSDTLSPSSPDSDRLGGSVGLGRDVGPLHLDAAYALVVFLPRQASGQAMPSRYNASAHLFALTFSFKRSPTVAAESPNAPASPGAPSRGGEEPLLTPLTGGDPAASGESS